MHIGGAAHRLHCHAVGRQRLEIDWAVDREFEKRAAVRFDGHGSLDHAGALLIAETNPRVVG